MEELGDRKFLEKYKNSEYDHLEILGLKNKISENKTLLMNLVLDQKLHYKEAVNLKSDKKMFKPKHREEND